MMRDKEGWNIINKNKPLISGLARSKSSSRSRKKVVFLSRKKKRADECPRCQNFAHIIIISSLNPTTFHRYQVGRGGAIPSFKESAVVSTRRSYDSEYAGGAAAVLVPAAAVC